MRNASQTRDDIADVRRDYRESDYLTRQSDETLRELLDSIRDRVERADFGHQFHAYLEDAQS